MKKTGINILIVGKTGVGKSSFCNYIFNEELFKFGVGKPVTGWDEHFSFNSIEYDDFILTVYDTVGIEPDNYNEWLVRLNKILNEKNFDGKSPEQWIHASIYLINAASARVEEVELDLIKALADKIITNVVLTNCDTASSQQILEIKKVITSAQPNMHVGEVCSVASKKRSGVISEKYGKDEVINCILGRLDIELRDKLIKYALDQYYKTINDAKLRLIKLIDDSSIGLINIITSAIKKGEDFDASDVFNIDIESDLDVIKEQYEASINDLDYFLYSIGYKTDNDAKSIVDIAEEVHDKVTNDVEAVFLRIESRMSSVSDAFNGNSFWEKAKAVAYIGSIAIDIKGFIRSTVVEMFDSALTSIEKYKFIYTK